MHASLTGSRLLAALLLVAGSVPAAAQSIPSEPDPDAVRVRLGPLWVNPSVALTNAGVDDNVFNDTAPQRDFTMTLSPAAQMWLRVGRTWLTGNVREDLVWFKQFGSERSTNASYALGWLVPLNRLAFTVGGTWVDTRERPGFEIDARPDRRERGVYGAVEVRALSKTSFGMRAARRGTDFDEDAVFLETNLHDQLNRTETSAAVTVRHDLTPLTRLSFEVGRQQDRFTFIPLRDADSTSVSAGVEFDPFALLKGSARIGYREFTPHDELLPGYSGATVAVDLAYVALGTTRVNLQATRDVQYSFEFTQPYYLQTGMRTSVAQQIFGPVDIEGRFGRQRLAYRDREANDPTGARRVDRVRTYGVGVGYRLGTDLRVGFNVDDQKRTSDVDSRMYDGLRYGMTVTYGL